MPFFIGGSGGGGLEGVSELQAAALVSVPGKTDISPLYLPRALASYTSGQVGLGGLGPFRIQGTIQLGTL